MSIHAPRLGLALLAGLLGLAAFAQRAEAQQPFQVAPGLNVPNPYNAGAMGFNPYTNPNAFFNRMYNPTAGGGFNPYGGASMTSSPGLPNPFPPFPYGYYNLPDPWSGNLYGSAAVINASGQYMLSTQQAFLMQQQVKREKIENRRRVLEEWLWERNNLPTAQDEFERNQRLELRRQQNDPPVNEILSAQALNVLLIDIQKHMTGSAENGGPEVRLDEELLRKINVTPPGKGSANIGLLKNDKLSWPLALRGAEFKRDRDLLDTLTPEAKEQAAKGAVDVATLKQLNQSIDKLLADLAGTIKEMPPAQYIESKRFLNDFKDAVRALSLDDASHYFSGKYSAKGKTVAELVKNMTREGLRFAPSVPGNEGAYVALHRALAAFDVSINRAVVEQPR